MWKFYYFGDIGGNYDSVCFLLVMFVGLRIWYFYLRWNEVKNEIYVCKESCYSKFLFVCWFF